MFYARVVFQKNASAAESHDDIDSARRWIEDERVARPESFQSGEIFERGPDWRVVATCDSKGWKPHAHAQLDANRSEWSGRRL